MPTNPQPAADDDRALVGRANGGDRAAFDLLYARHRAWVLGVAMKLAGSEADALDVLQESFLYLFGRFPGFELTPGASLRAYLYPVVRHQVVNLIRKRRRVVSLEAENEAGRAEPPPSFQPPPSRDLERRLEALSEGHREVVQLRFVMGMKLAEIAAVMKLPTGTIKSRLHHALKALKALRAREEAEQAALHADEVATPVEPSGSPER